MIFSRKSLVVGETHNFRKPHIVYSPGDIRFASSSATNSWCWGSFGLGNILKLYRFHLSQEPRHKAVVGQALKAGFFFFNGTRRVAWCFFCLVVLKCKIYFFLEKKGNEHLNMHCKKDKSKTPTISFTQFFLLLRNISSNFLRQKRTTYYRDMLLLRWLLWRLKIDKLTSWWFFFQRQISIFWGTYTPQN